MGTAKITNIRPFSGILPKIHARGGKRKRLTSQTFFFYDDSGVQEAK
jgi:hypothetical protein